MGNFDAFNELCRNLKPLGCHIGIMVIAVGVQTQQELDVLAVLGFDGVTGPAVVEPD